MSSFKDYNQDYSDHNIFFTRLTKLVNKLYSSEDQLINNNDIKDYACSKLQTTYVVDETKRCQRNESDFNLRSIIFKMNWLMYLKGILLNFGQYMFGCIGIYFLDLITNDLQQPDFNQQSKFNFILMILLLFICFLLKTILYSMNEWLYECYNSKQQIFIQYLIFNKSLRTQSYCDSRDHSNQADITNLLTSDTKESVYIFYGIVEMISGNATVLIILYFIYTKLGSAIIYGLIVLVVSVLLNVYILNLINDYFDLESKWTDKRLSLTKDVVEGMKSIKYLGWEEIFLNKIQELRSGEFNFTKKTRYAGAFAGVLWICLGYILLYVFLISYSSQGNDVLKQNIFTILALFGYLKYPLGNVPFSVSYFLKSLVSLRRIQKYLNQKEISSIDYDYNIDGRSNDIAISIQSTKFFWPRIEDNQQQNLKNEVELKSKQESLNNDQEEFLKSQEQFNLSIDNLSINKGSLNFIIGEIGSGKTALLLSILNELDNQQNDQTEYISKRIQINGKIGYVSANHWLQSRTIRENILFGEEFNEEWYNKCVTLCQLDEDFAQFPKSDQKIIGPGGSNLSGGQRQRIALCRSIYQKKDIYLFDDVFSSLDAHVAKKIFQQVIIELLYCELKSTVLFVTSHYDFIQQNKNFSIIYIKNGMIINDNDEIQKYLSNSIKKEHENQIQDEKQSHKLISDNHIEKDNSNGEYKSNKSNVKNDNNPDTTIQEKQDEEEDEDEDEEREKGSIKVSTLILFFKSRGLFVTFLHVLFSFITQASQMLIDFWLRDYSQEGDNNNLLVKLMNQIFDSFDQIFQLLTIINLIIALFCGLFYSLSAIRSSRYVFEKLNKYIVFSKLTFFDQNPVGRILSRVSTDQNKVDDVLQWHFHVFLEKLAYLLGYPIGMIIQLPQISIVFVIIMFLAYLLQLRYRAAIRQIKRLNQVNESQVLTVLTENCKGIPIIRAMEKEDFMICDLLEQTDKYISSQIVSNALQIWFIIRLFMLSNSSFLFLVVSNIYSIVVNNEINSNTIALGLIYSMLFSTVFSDVMNFYSYLEQDILGLERISQYYKNDIEDLDKAPSQQADSDYSMIESNLENGLNDYSVSFKNVYLKYEQKVNFQDNKSNLFEKNEQYALRDVTFNIKKGEKIAFCGRTGSGKTSILNVLFRLYDIQSGSITINQKDIYQQKLKSLRKQMSIIPQYGFLFNSSLQQNLDPNNKLQKNEIQSVLSKFSSLQIKKQDNISTDQQDKTNDSQSGELNSKSSFQDDNILNMEIQESGKNLSNGEKQIINFFRIVLRDSEIICLDEATSNMDPKTDKELHEQLFKFSEGKTLIVITHRLENIEMYDRVFVMNKGQIVEQGHVSTLRKIPNGFFNKLQKNE